MHFYFYLVNNLISQWLVIILTREVEEVLIDLPEELGRLEVDVPEPLEVEWSPGDKEEEDNTR